MQLPVDLKSLIDEATDIKAAQNTELSVSIYVDETAPAELVAHVRNAFASTMPTVRMALSYLDKSFFPQKKDDIAIVVAGESAKIGAAAMTLRVVHVPCMVVTLSPSAVAERAESTRKAVPEGDLVAPYELDAIPEGLSEPFVLDEQAKASLDDRMGRWIVSVCRDKRLAFAVAFPFMRKPLARDAVQATSMQNAGIGLVPIIPGADLPIMTLNQAKMMLQIAAAYGHEMDKDRVKELAAVIGGAYLCRTLARELVEFIPVLGFVFRTGIAYGGTAALGYAAIEYFEGGENVAGVANVAARAGELGTKLAGEVHLAVTEPESSDLVKKANELVPTVRKKANEVIPVVREKANEYIPVIKEMAAEYAPKVKTLANGLLAQVVAK